MSWNGDPGMRSSEKKRLRLIGIPGTLGIYRVRLVMDKAHVDKSWDTGSMAHILLDVRHTSVVVGRLAGR